MRKTSRVCSAAPPLFPCHPSHLFLSFNKFYNFMWNALKSTRNWHNYDKQDLTSTDTRVLQSSKMQILIYWTIITFFSLLNSLLFVCFPLFVVSCFNEFNVIYKKKRFSGHLLNRCNSHARTASKYFPQIFYFLSLSLLFSFMFVVFCSINDQQSFSCYLLYFPCKKWRPHALYATQIITISM